MLVREETAVLHLMYGDYLRKARYDLTDKHHQPAIIGSSDVIIGLFQKIFTAPKISKICLFFQVFRNGCLLLNLNMRLLLITRIVIFKILKALQNHTKVAATNK